MSAIAVRPPMPTDRLEWSRMWSTNCAHFSGSMTEVETSELWRRIMDPDHPISALVCRPSGQDGPLLGLAHYVRHPHTFSSKLVCYLEDLWVDPSAWRAGVARALVDALIARGKEQGWRRLYWHTEADNAAARALYDRITRATNYVRYDMALS